jgi:hypothetical protein
MKRGMAMVTSFAVLRSELLLLLLPGVKWLPGCAAAVELT